MFNNIVLQLAELLAFTSANKLILGDVSVHNVMLSLNDMDIKLIDYLNPFPYIVSTTPAPEYVDNFDPDSDDYDYTKNGEYNYTFDYIGLGVIIFNIYSRTVMHSAFLKDLYRTKEINTVENTIYVYNRLINKLTMPNKEVYTLHKNYKTNKYIPMIDKYFEEKIIINKSTVMLYLRAYRGEEEMLYDSDLLLEVLMEVISYDYKNRKIDMAKLRRALCIQ